MHVYKIKNNSFMKKIIMFIACIIILCGCENNTSKNQHIETNHTTIEGNEMIVEKKEYSREKQKIYYPQFKQGEFAETNKIIRTNAKDLLQKYIDENKEQSLELDYELYLVNEKIISICYKGVAYEKDNLYPRNVFNTINIYVNNKKEVAIREILEVDSKLIDIIKNKAIVNVCNKEILDDAENLIQSYNNEEFIEKLDNNKYYEKISVYFTNDSVGFSIPVLHALGDYINYEVSYKDLPQLEYNKH